MSIKQLTSITLTLLMAATCLLLIMASSSESRPLLGNDGCATYCHSCGFWGDFSGFRGSGYYLLNGETPPVDPRALAARENGKLG